MGQSAPTFVLTSLLCVFLSVLDTLAMAPEVLTDKGRVRGRRISVLNTPVDVFLGIPYAKPPLGRYRFRHPISIDPWDDIILDATKRPNVCMQGSDDKFGDFKGATMWNPNTPVSEDCLYLNVWRPKIKQFDTPKAVMVWIYGGSYLSGSSTLDVYDAKYLVAKTDVIVVSMQYRVGSLGFLSFDMKDAPGNPGVMDQVMALDWVQRNIHAFGGDSHNVTLFGESSGAASIGMHLLSPLSRGKFNRAILQSGSAQAPWATYTPKEAIRRSYAFARSMNCTEESVHDILRCLRSKPAEEFPAKEFTTEIAMGICEFPFVPMIDGSFLIESPDASLARRDFKKTPILVGSNINEGSWFLVYQDDIFNINSTSEINQSIYRPLMNKFFTYFPQYPQKLNSVGKDAVIFQYTPWKNPSSGVLNRETIDFAVGDLNFICPVVNLADSYALAGEKVYYYEFAHRMSTHLWPPWMGVLHGDEIFFVFGHPLDNSKGYSNKEKDLSRRMMKYWSNFAKTGDPNVEYGNKALNDWPVRTFTDKKVLKLDINLVTNHNKKDSLRIGPRSRHCAFWGEYLPRLVQKTADMSELEIEWKVQFTDWSNKYIVDWKNQFDHFLKVYERRLQDCGAH